MNPTPAEIIASRHAAGLTQRQAAAEIGMSWRAWQQWEYGRARMPAPAWAVHRLMRCEEGRAALALVGWPCAT